jgi:hypothetical protein
LFFIENLKSGSLLKMMGYKHRSRWYKGILEEQGASLGRPYADTIKGSTLTNMKELRVQHDGNPYRILFVFDPQRQAVLLVGGNKGGDKRWYEKNIPIAERRFTEYLEETDSGKSL